MNVIVKNIKIYINRNVKQIVKQVFIINNQEIVKVKNIYFFFHGMLYDIHTFLKIEKKLDECDYNLVFVEYNSFLKDNEESTYCFTQIKEMSDLIYEFICNFLEGKNPEKVILCGHSHGNNYPIELLDKFITNRKYVDKLSYIGIK